MPLDKMPDPEEFALTHYSKVLHVGGAPAACIVDESGCSVYASIPRDPSLRASLVGFLNRHEDLGLFFGFKLYIRTETELLEYVVYPDGEFVDIVIFDEKIHIINGSMENLFSLRKINTDQFVKTRSEFEKFKKMM